MERRQGWAQLGLAFAVVLLVRVPLASLGSREGWLAFDDLIPLMHPHQIGDFLVAIWNEYYQWPEVRGRYSLLGTPFRYLPLIPLGLLLGALLAALGAFRLTLYVRRLLGLAPEVLGPFAAGLLYGVLTLASKAHQLHTLFLGMGLLPWMILAFLRAISAPRPRGGWAWAGLAALLLWINPAIHLVVLGFGALTVLALFAALGGGGRHPLPSPLPVPTPLPALRAWGVVAALGLLPYGLMLGLSGPGLTTAATASVPPGLLAAWSGPLLPRLVLPLGLSLPETFRAGTYVFLDDLWARYGGPTLAFALFPVLALGALWRFRRSPLVLGLGALWLGSAFLATGVYYPLSGYRVLLALTELPGPWGAPARGVLAVLRNPDRWLLLASLMLAVLSGLGLASLSSRLGALLPRARRGISVALLGAVLLPFALHPAFRPLAAGDVGGVFRPVPLPEAYREAMGIVAGERTLYLPPMGARPLRWNLGKKTQDEALLLLHGGPSLEGVTGSPLLNQLYLMYAYRRLLYEGNSRALGAYLTLGGFRYLVFHDDVEDPVWPEEFVRVRRALDAQRDLVLRFEREGVAVFENAFGGATGPTATAATSTPMPFSTTISTPIRAPVPLPLDGVIAFGGSLEEGVALLEAGVDPRRVGLLSVGEGDLGWTTFRRWASELGPRLLVYANGGPRELLLGLLAADAARGVGDAGAVGYPNPGYGEGARPWWDHRWLNITAFNFVKFSERYGLFGPEGAQGYKLAATRTEGAELAVPLRIIDNGEYALFLRVAAPLGARVEVDVDGLYARELEILPSPGYRFVEVERLRLRAGGHRVRLRTLTNKPFVLNLAYAVPTRTLRGEEPRFEELLRRVAWVRSPEALLERLEDLRRARPDPERGIALYGFYGPVYWERRFLKANAEGGEPLRVRPQRSWWIGHLYELPAGASDFDFELEFEFALGRRRDHTRERDDLP